jgi:hypothetical protein
MVPALLDQQINEYTAGGVPLPVAAYMAEPAAPLLAVCLMGALEYRECVVDPVADVQRLGECLQGESVSFDR